MLDAKPNVRVLIEGAFPSPMRIVREISRKLRNTTAITFLGAIEKTATPYFVSVDPRH